METLNIITEKLNSANIAVKSEGMADYEIKADINVSGNSVGGINGRIARLSDKKELASFSTGGPGGPGGDPASTDNNLSVNYWVSNVTLQCEINQRINEFVAKLKENPSGLINYQS